MHTLNRSRCARHFFPPQYSPASESIPYRHHAHAATKAKKQLRKIDRKERETIIDAVDELEDLSNSKNVITLINHQYGYRLRVGNYRVLFDADTEVRIVEIQQVKKRDDHTY